MWCSTGWASAAWVAGVLPTGPVASVNTGRGIGCRVIPLIPLGSYDRQRYRR